MLARAVRELGRLPGTVRWMAEAALDAPEYARSVDAQLREALDLVRDMAADTSAARRAVEPAATDYAALKIEAAHLRRDYDDMAENIRRIRVLLEEIAEKVPGTDPDRPDGPVSRVVDALTPS